MFNAYEFTFDGHSCIEYDLMVYDVGNHTQDDVPFGNAANIIGTHTVSRVRPLHFGVDYNEDPLEFTIVFGAVHELDRGDFERIAMWLTGHQDYKWMSIGQADLDHLQFRCLVTELKPVSFGWAPYAFEATFQCDCPYAYGYPFSKMYEVSGSKSISFHNESSAREYLKPELVINPTSSTFRITNASDGGRVFEIKDIPTGNVEIHVDNGNGIIRESTSGYNLYGGFNLNFFRLVPGTNELTVEGNGVFEMSGRTLHNVAG